MVRNIRVKDYTFPTGSLSPSAAGLLDVYSDHVINGTIQSIYFGSNSYTTTGSILIFASGIGNSGVGLNDLILKVRAGSASNTTNYPFVYPNNNQDATGSPQAFVRPVLNTTLRVVGSAIGNATSGLTLSVRYI